MSTVIESRIFWETNNGTWKNVNMGTNFVS